MATTGARPPQQTDAPGPSPAGAPPTPSTPVDPGWSWLGELRGGLNGGAAMLPFVLSYGFIAFGALGAAASQAGLAASVTSFVLGTCLLALVGGLRMPTASPSSSNCLILAGAVLVWLRDPALQPDTAAGLAALLALAGACTASAGLLQMAIGLARAGRLVRYLPQQVLAGFMNGVAVLIVLSQVGPALGVDADVLARDGWAALRDMQPLALAVTAATTAVAWACARWAPRLPAALVALLLTSAAVLAWQHGAGPSAAAGLQPIGALQAELPLPTALLPLAGDGGWALLQRHAGTVATTALLLALGGINVVLGLFGALPLVYMRLRAINVHSAGGRSWRAALVDSGLIALVFAFALPLLALFPRQVLAGILVMLAWGLVDRWTLGLLRQGRQGRRAAAHGSAEGSIDGAAVPPAQGLGERLQSLAVIAAVCGVTVLWGFAPAVALGVLLSFVVLVQSLQRSLLRHPAAAAAPSRRVYPPALAPLLQQARRGIALLELEGALFFGNVEKLQQEVQALLQPPATVQPGAADRLHTLVLDLRRVGSIDASGAVTLQRLQERLAAQGVQLRLAGVTPGNRHGQALSAHGVLDDTASGGWALHGDADLAIEAGERAALARAGAQAIGAPVPLAHCELMAGLDAAGVARVAAVLRTRELAAGERLFAQGEPGSALYVLTAGSVSVVDGSGQQRFVSFSAGMTFGEMALLDGGGRSADAVADEASTVHALDAAGLAALEREHPALAARLYRNLALHLTTRLRDASGAWRQAAA
jgi:MFS superfamily sulfate permease-like transporter